MTSPSGRPRQSRSRAPVIVAIALAAAVIVDHRDRIATGTPLPRLTDSADDPAVGMTFPTLTGVDQQGDPMTIAPDGGPTMVLFVAHWCPHCQREVPVVQDWVDGGGLPRGVDLVTVSTVIDPRRPDYPPDEWLAGEGWTAPVLVDADNTAAAAAGLSATRSSSPSTATARWRSAPPVSSRRTSSTPSPPRSPEPRGLAGGTSRPRSVLGCLAAGLWRLRRVRR